MVMVMVDTVDDVLCAAMCCVRCCSAFSSTRYIFRRLSAFLWSDFVLRFCPHPGRQIFCRAVCKTNTHARIGD